MRCPAIHPVVLAILSTFGVPEHAVAQGGAAEGLIDNDGAILVIAGRIRGQVVTDLPPVMTLDEAEISAYGASSIAELIAATSPQTASGRGRGDGHPVILLNGQRISSFRILRNMPPEAIRRMEVLPEEVALRFGYPPDQRVINMILKDDYASRMIAGEYNAPTRGGFENWELEGGWLTIDGPRRLNLEAKIVEDTMLTEGERGVLQEPGTIPDVAGDPDPAFFRSLVDASRDITAGASWSTGLGDDGLGGSLGIDASYRRAERKALSGLDTVRLVAPGGAARLRSLARPLTRSISSDTFEGGLSLNTQLGSWQLSATLDASHSDQLTRTDRRADLSALILAAAAGTLDISGPLPMPANPGADRARARNLSLASLLTLSGRPATLPAGEVAVTIRAGFDFDRTTSSDSRTAVGAIRLKRGDASAGANIVLPLTSRKDGVAGALGDFTLNLSGGINHLSDFGTLTDWSAGLTWSPTETLTFQSSYLVSQAAPSLGQLGNPEVISFNVPVFDFSRGETVLVRLINGGNRNLRAETQRDIKLAVNWKLPVLRRSSLIIEYFRNSSDNVTQSFPLLTPAIEAAFPTRVIRDPAGRLIEIDRRPVTFDEVKSARLRWGLNLSGALAKAREERPSEGSGPRGGFGPGHGFGGRGDAQGGRWNLALYHIMRFTDRVRIAAGVPVLNQLAGDALTAGGLPRHEVELEGGLFHRGFGLRLNGKWSGPARVRASGVPGSSDLRFGSVTRLDLRVFVNFGMQERLIEKAPFLKGVRLALDIDNIFDSRQKVTDANGMVPFAYQPDFRDPRGRFVGVDLRKMF